MAEAAAKEPSMEDILSSIRKIIADEGKSPEQDAGSAPQQQAAPQPERPATAESAALSMPASPAAESADSGPLSEEKTSSGTVREAATRIAAQEMDAAPSPAPTPSTPMMQPAENPAPASAPAGTGSLASIAEAVKSRAAEDRATLAAAPTPSSQPLREPETPQTSTTSPLSDMAASIPEPKTDVQPVPKSVSAEVEPASPSAAPVAKPINEVRLADAIPAPDTSLDKPAMGAGSPDEASSSSEAEKDAASGDEAVAFKGALMSPSSGGAVSGAFDRLKRSTMDDMDAKTEAILRPMLREWLDENLPTLVERLVREEIERVARGN